MNNFLKFRLSLMMLFFSLISGIISAEGVVYTKGIDQGGGGPYRRVRTKSDKDRMIYCEFMVPIVNIPNSDRSREIRSTPGFYVGGGFSDPILKKLEVDAGLNYERGDLGNGVPEGWTVFMRSTRTGMNPNELASNPTGGWRAESDTTKIALLWTLGTDGKNYLEIKANSNINSQPGDVGTPGKMMSPKGDLKLWNTKTQPENRFVKRVIGIAQKGNLKGDENFRNSYEEDGSYMIGCKAFFTYVSEDYVWNLKSISDWGLTKIDNLETGFSPDNKDMKMPSKNNSIDAKYIVDFPNIPESQRSVATTSRYDCETVDIYLRKYIKSSGKSVIPNK